MRFTAAEQRAKLATLMKIEGYDSIEDLAALRPPSMRLFTIAPRQNVRWAFF